MSEQHPEPLPNPELALPAVDEAVLRRFSIEDPDIDTLFDELKEENPRLAWWLLGEAQRLSPDDMDSKAGLAELALRLYRVLSTQRQVDGLNTAFTLDLPEQRSASSAAPHESGEEEAPTTVV